MNDLLELPYRGRIMHHSRRKLVAIDLAVGGRARKRRFDGRHRFAFVQRVNGCIGIVNRNAGFREQFLRRSIFPSRSSRSAQGATFNTRHSLHCE